MHELAIKAKDLVKRYITYTRRGFFSKKKKVVEALKGVSFDVKWGEVFGLLGPNGAGKTTTVKVISTLLLPDDGKAWVAGHEIVEDPISVRDNIGIVLTVERGFFWKLTGRENLRYFGMLRGLKGKELEANIEKVVSLVGLDKLGAVDKLYEEYSLGMKARLALARAMLHDPPILILDEPTLGLDPPAAREIRQLIVRLARDEKKAVMITTHNMFEAEMICDRVAIISEGKIAALGTVDELKRLVSGEVPVVVKFTGIPSEGLLKIENTLKEWLGIKKLSVKEAEGGFEARILSEVGLEEKVIAEAISTLSRLGVRIHRVEVEEPSLEDVFITVTKGGEGAG
jgi:ABC-2 type transport system ATP-binding protein